MKYDATLQHLFQRSARGLLRTLTGSAVTEWLNVELPKTNIPRMDLLGRLSTGGLCHIEFQTTNELQMPERMGVYYLGVRIRFDADVDQYVIYLGKRPMRMNDFIRTPAMQFRYKLIDIRDLDGESLMAHGDVGDAMLAILAKVRNRPETIRRVLGRIGTLKGRARGTWPWRNSPSWLGCVVWNPKSLRKRVNSCHSSST